MVRLDPQYRIQFGAGGQLDCTPNIAEMEKQIAALSPADAPGFRRFLDENRTKLAAMEPCLESAFLGWQDLVQMRLLKMLPMLRPHQSVDTYLKRFFKDERVRLAFCFQSKYLGMSPFRCPSLFSILSFLEYEYGVFHPIGGCAAITAAMARVAERLGVEICLNEPVEEILFAGRRAVGVRTSDGHASRRCRGGQRRLRPRDGAPGARPSAPPLDEQEAREEEILLLDLHDVSRRRRQVRPAASHHSHRRRTTRRTSTTSRTSTSSATIRASTSRTPASPTPTLAPQGHSALYVLAPVSHQHPNVDWTRRRRASASCCFEKIAKAGYGDIEKRIRYERVITPADWDTRYEIYRGATFNLAHSLDQMLHLRPHNRFEDLDGMYLVGGGTHPGSGLPVIFESARISSRLLLEDLGVPSEPLTSSRPTERPVRSTGEGRRLRDHGEHARP